MGEALPAANNNHRFHDQTLEEIRALQQAGREVGQDVLSYLAKQVRGSKLDFRIAPYAPGAGIKTELTDRLVVTCMDLLKKGRVGQWWLGEKSGVSPVPAYTWLPISGELANASQLVTGEYNGRKYVLVSDKPGQTMVHGEGRDAWGLARVYQTKEIDESPEERKRLSRVGYPLPRGWPAVGFELDERGAERFSALTKANVDSALAIVIDGKVVSAPVIKSALGMTGMIAGKFTQEQVNSFVDALRTGMPPVHSASSGPASRPAVDLDALVETLTAKVGGKWEMSPHNALLQTRMIPRGRIYSGPDKVKVAYDVFPMSWKEFAASDLARIYEAGRIVGATDQLTVVEGIKDPSADVSAEHARIIKVLGLKPIHEPARPAPSTAPATRPATQPAAERDRFVGVWVHKRADQPVKGEPDSFLMQLRKDGIWAYVSVWGEVDHPSKVSVTRSGTRWKVGRLSRLFVSRGRLPEGEYSLALELDHGSMSIGDEWGFKDADTLVSYRFESILIRMEWRRAAPGLDGQLEAAIEASSATQPAGMPPAIGSPKAIPALMAMFERKDALQVLAVNPVNETLASVAHWALIWITGRDDDVDARRKRGMAPIRGDAVKDEAALKAVRNFWRAELAKAASQPATRPAAGDDANNSLHDKTGLLLPCGDCPTAAWRRSRITDQEAHRILDTPMPSGRLQLSYPSYLLAVRVPQEARVLPTREVFPAACRGNAFR